MTRRFILLSLLVGGAAHAQPRAKGYLPAGNGGANFGTQDITADDANLSGNANVAGAVNAGTATFDSAMSGCSGGIVCIDSDSMIGGTSTDTTDPTGRMVKGASCWAGDGTCTAGPLMLVGGSGIIDIQIDGADPTVTCAGDNDSVTLTIVDAANTAVLSAVALTEGTEWTASASVATTCASLATAVNTACTVSSVDYCDASCTSPEVQITLTPNAASMTALTESTAGCTTVATLAPANVVFASPNLSASTSGGPCMINAAAASAVTGGGFAPACSDTDTRMTGAAGTFEFWANGARVATVSSIAFAITSAAALTAHQFYCQNATLTCADNGGGTPAACTATNIDSRCAQLVTCNDADGCALTLDESSAAAGQRAFIMNVGTNNVTIADSAGVQETDGGATLTLGTNDTVEFVYGNTTWAQLGQASNN